MDRHFPGVNASEPVDPNFLSALVDVDFQVNQGNTSNFNLQMWWKQMSQKPSMVVDVSTVSPLYSLIQDQKTQLAVKVASIDYANGLGCQN